MAQPSHGAASSPFSWGALQSHIRYLSVEAQQKVKEAFDVSMRVHEGQKRRSGEPYFSHPFETAQTLAAMHADAETLIAALLHDVLEDTEISEDEIEERFGAAVRAMVEALTKLDAEEFAEKPTLDEQTESLRKIFTFMQEDVRIMVIKLADRLHNMRTAEHLPEERRRALAEETRDVYVKIADRLSMQDVRDSLAELCWKVLDPALLTQMLRLRSWNERKARTIIVLVQKALHQAPEGKGVTVRYEQSRFRKLKAQLDAGVGKVTGITPLALVFLCDSVVSCYQILGVLHQNWLREAMSFEDFINVPMLNGYRGLHTTIILNDGTRVRCKIRTRDMHAYARSGVTTRCFSGGEKSLSSYFAWGKHISPLLDDTSDRSREFWESLQSDILGESIIVYCADGRSIQLPIGATALDAAFYFFGEQAFRVKSVIVNGKPSAFHSTIEHTATAAFEFARKRTLEHRWIPWVKTGLALAQIRDGLSQESKEKKIERGKQLLEQVMVEKRRGLLAEFSEESMEKGMQRLGFLNLEEGYVALAEGMVEPQTAYRSLFVAVSNNFVNKSSVTTKQEWYVARFFVNRHDSASLRGLLDVYAHSANLITHAFFLSRIQCVIAILRASGQDAEEIKSAAFAVGAARVEISSFVSLVRYVTGVALLLVVWGIDPVIARLLVTEYDVSPTDLTLIRFWTLTALCGGLLLIKRIRGGLQREASIPIGKPSLWISAVLLLLVAWSTYAALQSTWPSHYTIPMTAAGLVLTSIQNARRWHILSAMWLLFACGILLLMLYDAQWGITGILLTLMAVTCFSMFSVVSERYKRSQQVAGRALQYFFVLSLICLLLSSPLIAFNTIARMSPTLIASSVLFSIAVAGLPYFLYYNALSHKQIDFVLRYSFLIIFASIAGQWVMLGQMNWLIMTAAMVVMVGAVLPLAFRESSDHA